MRMLGSEDLYILLSVYTSFQTLKVNHNSVTILSIDQMQYYILSVDVMAVLWVHSHSWTLIEKKKFVNIIIVFVLIANTIDQRMRQMWELFYEFLTTFCRIRSIEFLIFNWMPKSLLLFG